jgi:hypothetical protein
VIPSRLNSEGGLLLEPSRRVGETLNNEHRYGDR